MPDAGSAERPFSAKLRRQGGHPAIRVLIFGATGQLGRELVGTAPRDIELVLPDRSQADLERPGDVAGFVRALHPEVIINAAAYTAVDRAEMMPDVARAVNAAAPAAIAEAAATIHATFFHLSTDYVFGGRQRREPYGTTEPVAPISAYGKSKAEGERLVLERGGGKATIVRTSWLYSKYGRNFVLTMLDLMRRGGPLRVVADQTGSPTWARPLAHAIWAGVALGNVGGILHWTDVGPTTWHGFAEEISRQGAALGLLPGAVEVQPVATSDYSADAARPAFSVLDLSDTPAKLGVAPIPWTESRSMMLEELPLE